jgi:GNAT superfamily N-acetyltransferase
MIFQKQSIPVSFRLPSVLEKHIRTLSPDSEHQRDWLRNCFKMTEKKESSLYYAKSAETGELIGLFALSISKPDNTTSWMIIDYLYVLPQYRASNFAETPFKASELILAEIITVAKKISIFVTLDLIALQLAHDRLQEFYESMGFVVLQRGNRRNRDTWMGLNLELEE